MYHELFSFPPWLLAPSTLHCICNCFGLSKASGGVYQWGTGLLNQAKRALDPQPVPAHLGSKEPFLVPGRLHGGLQDYGDFA